VLDDAAAVDAEVDAAALDDDDELDPHPAITATTMATATAPAPTRERSDLNMGPPPPLETPPACRSAFAIIARLGESKAVRPACSKCSRMKDFAIRIVGFAIWIADDRRLTPRQQDGWR
jgi:hypothetical protein